MERKFPVLNFRKFRCKPRSHGCHSALEIVHQTNGNPPHSPLPPSEFSRGDRLEYIRMPRGRYHKRKDWAEYEKKSLQFK